MITEFDTKIIKGLYKSLGEKFPKSWEGKPVYIMSTKEIDEIKTWGRK